MTRRHLATPRIGPKMIAAVEYAGDHPGTTQQQCAIAIGPNGSHAFGSRAVQRALRAGLIEDRSTTAAYSLYVTAKGLDAYNKHYGYEKEGPEMESIEITANTFPQEK